MRDLALAAALSAVVAAFVLYQIRRCLRRRRPGGGTGPRDGRSGDA